MQTKHQNTMKYKLPWSLLVPVFLILCGAFLISIHSKILNYLLVLTPNSIVTYFWSSGRYDVPSTIYLFNWTNPEDIYNKSVKPKFEQVGPYNFLVNEEKLNLVWNDNGTVTYQERTCYRYDDQKEDNGNLDDVITSLNPTAATVAHMARHRNYFIRKGLSFTLSRTYSSLHIKRKAREILFEGFPDPLIKVLNSIPFLDQESIPQMGKFSYFGLMNCSRYYGTYNLGTGINSTLGKLYRWKYKSQNPYYKGSCSHIQESVGEIFPQGLRNESLHIFEMSMFRSGRLKYTGPKFVAGVEARNYVMEDQFLDNGTKYPDNECFCDGECIPSGVSNAAPTKSNAPIYFSLPHFTRADPFYVNSVEGMIPDANKYDFSLAIEPTTGITVEVNLRLQTNVLLQPVPSVTLFEHAPKIVFPVAWMSIKIEHPGYLYHLIRIFIVLPDLCLYGGILCIGLALTLALFIQIRRTIKKKKLGYVLLNQSLDSISEDIPKFALRK